MKNIHSETVWIIGGILALLLVLSLISDFKKFQASTLQGEVTIDLASSPLPASPHEPQLRAVLPFPEEVDAPLPAFQVEESPTEDFDRAWHDFLGVAGQAGIEFQPDRLLSFSDWQWLGSRMNEFTTAIDAVEEESFDAKAEVMERKMERGDYDVIVLGDTPPEEIHRLKQPTKPGQVVALAGSGGQMWIIRINLEDAPILAAAHNRIQELEQMLVLEVITRLRIR